MSQFLRTLWSATTCEFCGTRHDLGICPNCGSRRTEGEHQYLESPHIEKLRAMKQVILRYKAEESRRIAEVRTLSIQYLTQTQKRIIEYIMRIVNELTGEDLKITAYHESESFMFGIRRSHSTQMMYHLNKMLEYMESALDVEKTLADIITPLNGDDIEGTSR